MRQHLAAKVLDRHLRREDAALAGGIGVRTRHIVEHAELNHPVQDWARAAPQPSMLTAIVRPNFMVSLP